MNAPRFAFRTRDRLVALDDCPDVEDNAPQIMRPCKPYPPLVEQPDGPLMRTGGWLDYRKYERTGEMHEGLPLYEETL